MNWHLFNPRASWTTISLVTGCFCQHKEAKKRREEEEEEEERRGQRVRKSRFRISGHVVNADWPMSHVVSGLRVRTHIETHVDRTVPPWLTRCLDPESSLRSRQLRFAQTVAQTRFISFFCLVCLCRLTGKDKPFARRRTEDDLCEDFGGTEVNPFPLINSKLLHRPKEPWEKRNFKEESARIRNRN